MDKLTGLASKIGSSSSNKSSNTGSSVSAGKEYYLDKGLDSAEEKFGGGKVDPAKTRNTAEKVTDAQKRTI